MEHRLPLNDERLLSLRLDEAVEQLHLREAWLTVEQEERAKARERALREVERSYRGGEEGDPYVVVRNDDEAKSIADSPLPNMPPEWEAWEQEELDPTKAL